MKAVLGIDVGGTNIKFGIFDLKGSIIKRLVLPTEITEGGGTILPNIAKVSAKLRDEIAQDGYTLLGVGIGMPGPVEENGFVTSCVNLSLEQANPSSYLSGILGDTPVYTSNDANMAALGEMWKGGGKGYRSLVLVTLGTGVGSGIVLNGKPVNGSRGIAGEIGHIVVNPYETERCSCGKRGCLDQVASATGIVRYAKQFMEQTSLPSDLREMKDITAKAIFEKAQLGDSLAYLTIDFCMSFLGKCLSDVSYIIDPQIFIIGGGVSQSGEFLIQIIRRHYKKNALFIKNQPPIINAIMGGDAGMCGAAKMVFDMERIKVEG